MTLSFLHSPLLPLLFLLGSLFLTLCSSAALHLGKFKSKELLRKKALFRPVLKRMSKTYAWENLYFCISLTKHIYELAYAITAFFFLISQEQTFHSLTDKAPGSEDWSNLLLAGFLIVTLSIFLDFVMRVFAHLWSKPVLKFAAPFASLYLLVCFPLVGPLLKLIRLLGAKASIIEEGEMLTDKSTIRELIRESELQQHLDPTDQKLISSFLLFKERVAKEIMVPRVDVFSLPADTPIREAATLLAREGYSRIPVTRESLDQIIGVALYKDLLKSFANPNLDQPISSIVKPVLYAPENKKIAQLLQEFRSKQIHMAIIVDEYGGTEGIVTIEDILEELVGEIEDESDINEDQDFVSIPGGWIVDAKMTLIDIETNLGIQVPSNPDYETIGGYVFHCAGTIPTKGWRLSHDEFDLEVIASDERSLKKIKIIQREKRRDD